MVLKASSFSILWFLMHLLSLSYLSLQLFQIPVRCVILKYASIRARVRGQFHKKFHTHHISTALEDLLIPHEILVEGHGSKSRRAEVGNACFRISPFVCPWFIIDGKKWVSVPPYQISFLFALNLIILSFFFGKFSLVFQITS